MSTTYDSRLKLNLGSTPNGDFDPELHAELLDLHDAIEALANAVGDTVDFNTEVAKGNVEGHEIIFIQGINTDVDTSNPENLWDAGGNLVYPTEGEQWEILSTSANDTVGGIGAREVFVTFLDDQFVEKTEMVALNGTTPVLFNGDNAYRGRQALVMQAGSLGHNEGAITLRSTTSGLPRLVICTLGNSSLHGFYTVPAGKTAFLIYSHTSIGKNKDANILFLSTVGDNLIFFRNVVAELYQNVASVAFDAPLGRFFEKSEIAFLCDTQNNNTSMSAFIQLLLVDNEFLDNP